MNKYAHRKQYRTKAIDNKYACEGGAEVELESMGPSALQITMVAESDRNLGEVETHVESVKRVDAPQAFPGEPFRL